MSVTSVGATMDLPDGFRIGNVLGRAVGVLSRHVVLFVLVAAAAQLPSLVIAFLVPGIGVGSRAAGFMTIAVVSWFTIVVILPITQTIVYHGAFQDMCSRPIRFGDSLTLAFRRFFPVLGALICMGVLIMVGFLLLVVPGIIALTVVAVAVPVCVVERVGPFASIRRSARLTKGNRWKILGIFLLLFVASIAIAGLNIVFRYGLGAEVAVLVNFVLQSALGAYSSLIAVVMYHDLRVAKEGLDTNRIAAVFD
jgi:hypothetical protein